MCVKARCTNRTAITEMVSKCDPTNCHNKGICNNVGNCHCKIGYGGISCDIPGFGGSVNSGPASDSTFNPSLFLLYFTIFGLIVFVIATIYCKRKFNIWLHKEVLSSTRKVLKLQSVLVPVRPAPPPPGARQRHSHNPLDAINSMWNRFSNSHSQQRQATPEVLTVRAVMPVLPHHYTADDISPVHFQPTRYESPPEIIGSRLPIRSDSYKRSTQIPPAVPEHRRLNAPDSHSSSSDEASHVPKPTRNESIRPSKAPPPLPTSSKPKLPPKPVINKNTNEDEEHTQISVKNLAAKFDAKLSNI